MNNIGIIGYGFVGKAVKEGFSTTSGVNYSIRIYDKNPHLQTHDLNDVVNKSNFVFISVPTPSREDGSIDLKIIWEVFESIAEVKNNENVIFLLRSTVTPGTTGDIIKKYPDLNIVFNPEFLTERSAAFDFMSQTRVILGGEKEVTKKVSKFYKGRFGESLSVIETDNQSAELIKYMCNTFLALKVSYLNEMRQLALASGADWDDVVNGFKSDGRIGPSHTNIPGPDGKLGFGGSCFPKDIRAIIDFAKTKDINLRTLEGAWDTNLEVRPERDWEDLKGRAVSE